MFCGLLPDRSGIISYLLLLSQQLTYRKGTAVMEISRKQNWIGCIINGADSGADSQPRGGKSKSESVIPSLPSYPGPSSSLSCFCCEQLHVSSVLKLFFSGNL